MIGDKGRTTWRPEDWMGRGADLAERMEALAERLRLAASFSPYEIEGSAYRASAADIDGVLSGELDPRDESPDDAAGTWPFAGETRVEVVKGPRWPMLASAVRFLRRSR